MKFSKIKITTIQNHDEYFHIKRWKFSIEFITTAKKDTLRSYYFMTYRLAVVRHSYALVSRKKKTI